MKPLIRLLLLSVLTLNTPAISAGVQIQSIGWHAKVDSWVLETGSLGETEFIVFLDQQADLAAADRVSTKQEKGELVYALLTDIAARTQGPLLTELRSQGIQHRPFWVANMVWVKGDSRVIQEIALRNDVAHIFANPKVRLDIPPVTQTSPLLPQSDETVEWNLTRVRAPEVWAMGYSGQGVVIGGQDTGYQWDHPALKGKYRGWDGDTADHNYNWHDAIHTPGGGGHCGPDSSLPCDDGDHGTHTMGIMVGDDGGANQIGIAPEAKWIGCRNMDQGVGTPATYSECYQWFIAPTNLNGQNPQPALAPDVINNSWSCPVSEGCTNPDVLLTVVENVRAAGIVTVHAAGNSGPTCNTVNTPAAIYEASFTVGATDYLDNITYYSSRGPVSVDGSSRLKPNVAAPGDGVRSSVPLNGYAYKGGTSMAAPHVAGLVALIISAQPSLSGQVDMIEAIITRNADPRTTSQICGGIPGTTVPNNIYGWGRINSRVAIENALKNFDLQKKVESIFSRPGEPITYTLQITQTYPLTVTNVTLTDTVPANTTFLNATAPYTLNDQTVQWVFPSLGVNETRIVELVVRAPTSGSWTIINQDFGVKSAQAAIPVVAESVYTLVAEFFNLFPIIFKP